MSSSGLSKSSLPFRLGPLFAAIQSARARTDAFFSRFVPASFALRSIAERHRLIFYLGHLDAFDANLIGHRVLFCPSVDPSFDRLFAFGIDPVDGSLPCDVPSDWPDADDVRTYNQRVRAVLDAALTSYPSHNEQDVQALCDALSMCIEHRLMHLETLSYMLPHLPLAAFRPDAIVRVRDQPGPRSPGYARTGAPLHARRIEVPAGQTQIGRQRDDSFGWDNEFGALTTDVPAFAIDARNVTHEEFLCFVRDGGYQERSLWSDADWEWKEQRGIRLPTRFIETGNDFHYRAALEEIPLPLDWPVQVSLAEARAYVRFLHHKDPHCGVRLPSEAELHRAADADGSDKVQSPKPFPWQDEVATPLHHGNFGCLREDPCPVAAFPAGDSALGVADLYGNGWEWTETPFGPLPGFQIDPRYPGYSQNFFDGRHFVIRGAAACTDVCFVRRSFRNWFQDHYPYVFATFRCVYDATPIGTFGPGASQ